MYPPAPPSSWAQPTAVPQGAFVKESTKKGGVVSFPACAPSPLDLEGRRARGTAAEAGEPRAGGTFGGHVSSGPAGGPQALQGQGGTPHGPRDVDAWPRRTPDPGSAALGFVALSPRPAWHPRPQSDRPRPPCGFSQLSGRVRASGGQPGSAPSRLALLPAQRQRPACGVRPPPTSPATWPSLRAPPAGPQGGSGSAWPGTPPRRRATVGRTCVAAAAGSWTDCPCPFNGVRGRGLAPLPAPPAGRRARENPLRPCHQSGCRRRLSGPLFNGLLPAPGALLRASLDQLCLIIKIFDAEN